MENLKVSGIRLASANNKGGDSYWKENLPTWFCMSRRCAIPRAGWTGQGQPQLSPSPLFKWSPFFLPSLLFRKLAMLANEINTQSAFNRAVTPRTVFGLQVQRRTEEPGETTSYWPRDPICIGAGGQVGKKCSFRVSIFNSFQGTFSLLFIWSLRRTK